MATMTAREAWEALKAYRRDYYDSFAAMYSGDHKLLRQTAEGHTFWKRDRCNCRVHVPIAADIAQTSANLLFSQQPRMSVFHGESDTNEEAQQNRFDEIAENNALENKLNEAAETAAALGDVYFKLRWDLNAEYPMLEIVQPDNAVPEYRLGQLDCLHFFTIIKIDPKTNKCDRIYECYERGRITMLLFRGDADNLGTELPESELAQMGFKSEIVTPVQDMLAVHIANIRPNRRYRNSMRGRSDMDGLRDMCDALDEAYSSWIRDIRLAKAKTIVPLDYLRKKPSNLTQGCEQYASWEFDPDVETYVAMDINPDVASGTGIDTIQPEIRAEAHAKTCAQYIQDIVMHAGYSPQSFGFNIDGMAQSGTALNIREKKSIITRDKKKSYWQGSLEAILTAMIHLDAALYPAKGSHADDVVKISFSDTMGVDINSVASAIQMLHNAQAVSLEQKVTMQHPDWSLDEQKEEIERIKAQYALNADSPIGDYVLGDGESDMPREGDGE